MSKTLAEMMEKLCAMRGYIHKVILPAGLYTQVNSNWTGQVKKKEEAKSNIFD